MGVVREHRRVLTRVVVAAVSVIAIGGGSAHGAAAAPATAAAQSVDTSPWSFTGRGFGHGVGMSQYGALAQAKAGRSAREILGFYYAGTTYDAVPDTQTIRVNIVRGRSTTAVSGLARSSGGGTLTVTAGSSTLRAAAGRSVSLRRSGSSVVASCSGCSPASVTGSAVSITWDQTRTDLSLGGKRYAHAPFVVTPTPGAATLEGVLHLRLADEYLDQVREVPWSWPDAALETQAAAARAYALRKVAGGVRSACACHVQDSITDQVYGAVPTGSEASAWPRWRAAVAAGGSSTTGYVPRYGGQVIEALYSSSSGGHTVNNEDIWGGAPVPYLRGVPDPWSTKSDNPRRSWTTEVPRSKVATAFGLPDVRSLDLSERTSAGSVRWARATSSAGVTKTLRGDDMRRALGLSSASTRRPGERVTGDTPADLAAATARSAPSTATSVVIAPASQTHVAHLVMARPLAGSLRAPLLLSGTTRLAHATRTELDRRGGRITRAYVVGGGPMINTSVITELRARGITVTRVGMSDQDATAAAIVDLMAAQGPITRAAVATQETVPEAGAFSAVAGTRREPIVWASRSAVGPRAKAALQRARVRSVRIIGSSSRIPTAVSSDLSASGFSPSRLAGTSSAEISAGIAQYFRNSYSATRVSLARSTSTRTSDPAIAAAYGEPVLIVGTAPPAQVVVQVQRSPQWPSIRAVGPSSRVTSTTLARVRDS